MICEFTEKVCINPDTVVDKYFSILYHSNILVNVMLSVAKFKNVVSTRECLLGGKCVRWHTGALPM
jgi:hypothetical protein